MKKTKNKNSKKIEKLKNKIATLQLKRKAKIATLTVLIAGGYLAGVMTPLLYSSYVDSIKREAIAEQYTLK